MRSCAATIIGTCEVSLIPLRTVACTRIVGDLWVERGQCRDCSAQHVHGVRGLHGLDDVEDRRRQLAGGLQLGVDAGQLRLGRQLAVQQQVGGLLEGRVLGQIVDGIAAIAQLAGLAVDESSFRPLEVDILEAAMDLGLQVRPCSWCISC